MSQAHGSSTLLPSFLRNTDSSGSIDEAELKKLCKKLGRDLDPNQLAQAMTVLDKDKCGQVSLDESTSR